MSGVLVFFHCPSNTGYAISTLERVFFDVAHRLAGNDEAIHFAYPDLSAGRPTSLPPDFGRVFLFDPRNSDVAQLRSVEEYVRRHDIGIALGFDQPVRQPGYSALRRGGVRSLVSYCGAPMSSLNGRVTLALKRLDVTLARNGPDHFIFESLGMQRTAVRGRGIPRSKTSVTYLGVDPQEFRPPERPDWYAHDTFAIPRERRIVFYSGHMETRKGVHVLVKAVVDLVAGRGVKNIHLLIIGNQAREAAAFDHLYVGTPAESHITFGGYRDDVSRIMPGAYVGAIASTGWDSFTLSAVEMASCGIPLVVSSLPGLDETVDAGETGIVFPVGEHAALADRLLQLVNDPLLRRRMSDASRRRTLSRFTRDRQIDSLASTISQVDSSRGARRRST